MIRRGPGCAHACGRVRETLPKFSSKLLVRHLASSLPFYREVLDATVRYADDDFAVLTLLGTDFMLHADHAYDHHPPLPSHCRLRVNAAWGRSFAFLGWTRTKWRNKPNASEPLSCHRRRISPTDGEK